MKVTVACVRSTLLAAADVMRKGGMLRGRLCDYSLGSQEAITNGPHCLLGAIQEVTIYPLKRIDCVKDSYETAMMANNEAVKAVAKLLPQPTELDVDPYNHNTGLSIAYDGPYTHCAWWNNTIAADAEAVAQKLELAAASLTES